MTEAKTVLLVDDDDQLREFCGNVLLACGFQVHQADNGLEALLIAAQLRGAVDLLITDLAMPRINGVELANAFKTIWPEVNVLYISGSPPETVEYVLPVHCAFLTKPFATDALLKSVENCLEVHA